MRLFLGLFLIVSGISYAQEDPNLSRSANTQTEAGSPSSDCTDCPPGETSRLAQDTLKILNEDSTCPESVKQIKLLMASTYGSCDAMNVRLTKDKMIERSRAITVSGGNRLGGECWYGRGHNCTDLSTEAKYQNAIRNHPYNNITPKCEPQPECNIAGKQRPCPGFFFMGNQNNKDAGPYRQGGREIDPTQKSYLNVGKNGSEFIGWNCSEYVATAMRLAGLNMKGCGNDKWSWWNVQRMSDMADKKENCSCMDTVDLSDPNEKIKPGDILLYGGHAMMVDASDTDFIGNLTQPSLQNNCAENSIACKHEIHSTCSEDNIEPNDLKFSINHASDSFQGIGPSSMNYSDYEGVRGYDAKGWNSMRHFQEVRSRVKDLFEQSNEFEDLSSNPQVAGFIKSAYSMWLEGKMETSVFFESFLQEHVGKLNILDDERLAISEVDETTRAMSIVRKGNSSTKNLQLSAYSMWLEGKMETDVFKSAFLGEANSSLASTWPNIRTHMSYLCKSRLCKKHNLDSDYCKQVVDVANMPQSNKNNRIFKVIRHNSTKDGCVDPNPPKLKNSCGDTCDNKADKGCLFSSS